MTVKDDLALQLIPVLLDMKYTSIRSLSRLPCHVCNKARLSPQFILMSLTSVPVAPAKLITRRIIA